MTQQFTDITLRIRQHTTVRSCRLTLLALDGSAAEAVEVANGDIDDGELSGPCLGLEAERGGQERHIAAAGVPIAPVTVRSALQEFVKAAALNGHRLRLRIDDATGGIQWEQLYIGDGADRLPLALDAHVSVVRSTCEQSNEVAALSDTPRVLIAAADPEAAGYGRLSWIEPEVDAIRDECTAYGGEVADVLWHVSPSMLRDGLHRVKPHVLHVAAHGEVAPTGARLRLCGEHPHAHLWLDELVGWAGQAGVRLVVLSACDIGGQRAAHSLTVTGVPAVLAMQGKWNDDTSPQFFREFYRELCANGDVEQAVSAGRRLLSGVGTQWAVPVLYVGAQHGRLWQSRSRAALRAAAPAAPPLLPPSNLEQPRPLNMVGREEDLERLHSLLTAPNNRPVAIIGMGGLGKTWLAAEYAHRYREDYPGGVFWLEAQDDARLIEQYASLGRVFGVSDRETANRAEAVRDALRRTLAPTLLVFDDSRPETSAHLMAPGPCCRVLTTTQFGRLEDEGFACYRPTTLSRDAAMELLQRSRQADTAEERRAAESIAQRVGYLPIALSVLASYVRRMRLTFQRCDERLGADRRLALLDDATARVFPHSRYSSGIFAAISLSHATLSGDAARLLATAACFAPRDIPEDRLFEACAGLDRPRFDAVISDLIDAALMDAGAAGRVNLHEIIRALALNSLPAPEQSECADRAAVALTRALSVALNAGHLREARRDASHSRAVVDLCLDRDLGAAARQLLRELGMYDMCNSDIHSALELWERAAALAERDDLGDDVVMGDLLFLLADARQELRRPVEAGDAARKALGMYERSYAAGDPHLGDAYYNLGYVVKRQHHYDEAHSLYQRALDIHLNSYGERDERVAADLNNIGVLYEDQGDHEKALEYLTRALDIQLRVLGADNVRGAYHIDTPGLMNNVGRVMVRLGRADEALALHRDALAVFRSEHTLADGEQGVSSAAAPGSEDNLDIAMTHCFIGEALASLARTGEAIESLRHGVAIMGRLRFAPVRSLGEYRELFSKLDGQI